MESDLVRQPLGGYLATLVSYDHTEEDLYEIIRCLGGWITTMVFVT